jgi:hypothetical protein
MSSVTDMTTLPSYREIIGMGNQVVPWLLQELEREPGHWFNALAAITKADPVPAQDRGNVDKMTEAWLRWAKDNRYLC